MRRRFLTLQLSGLLLMVGCGEQAKTLYPLSEGEKWTYQATIGKGTAMVSVTNLPARDLAGKSVTPQKTEISGQTYFSFVGEDSEGIFLLASQAPNTEEPQVLPNPPYLLRRPYEKGTKWRVQEADEMSATVTHGSLESTIQSVDETITVPAGTFESCVKVVTQGDTVRKIGAGNYTRQANVSVEQIAWFCPGVGMVKSIDREAQNPYTGMEERYTLQLESHVKGG